MATPKLKYTGTRVRVRVELGDLTGFLFFHHNLQLYNHKHQDAALSHNSHHIHLQITITITSLLLLHNHRHHSIQFHSIPKPYNNIIKSNPKPSSWILYTIPSNWRRPLPPPPTVRSATDRPPPPISPKPPPTFLHRPITSSPNSNPPKWSNALGKSLSPIRSTDSEAFYYWSPSQSFSSLLFSI